MNYNATTQKFFVEEVMDWAKKYFLAGKTRGLPDMELWAKEFLTSFAIELDLFASIIKHPSFAGEMERRVMTLLQKMNIFSWSFGRSAHCSPAIFPWIWPTTIDGKRKLPITRVFVGPGPAQQVSKISVGDLLLQCGYDGVPVELSSSSLSGAVSSPPAGTPLKSAPTHFLPNIILAVPRGTKPRGAGRPRASCKCGVYGLKELFDARNRVTGQIIQPCQLSNFFKSTPMTSSLSSLLRLYLLR